MIDLGQLCELAVKEIGVIEAGASGKSAYLRLRSGKGLNVAAVVTRWPLDKPATAEELETKIRNEFDALDEKRAWVQLVPAGSETASHTTRLMRDEGSGDAGDNDGTLGGALASLGRVVVDLVDRHSSVMRAMLERKEALEDVRAHAFYADGRSATEPRALELQASIARTEASRDIAKEALGLLKSGMVAGAAGAVEVNAATIGAFGERLVAHLKSGKMTAEEFALLQAQLDAFNAAAKPADGATPGGA